MNNVVEQVRLFLPSSSLTNRKQNRIKPNFFHNTSHTVVYYTES